MMQRRSDSMRPDEFLNIEGLVLGDLVFTVHFVPDH
jgi:hypothetical protein